MFKRSANSNGSVRQATVTVSLVKQHLQHLVFTLCLLAASPVSAGFDHFYVEPQISSDRLKVNSGHYNLVATGFKAGFYIIPKMSFEVLLVKGSREDKINDLTVKLDNRSSFFFRYGSDYHKRIRAYMSLGQSNTNISYAGPINQHKDKLSDLSWAIGAEERIRVLPGSYFNIEYARHFSNIDQFYSSLSMGLRYEF